MEYFFKHGGPKAAIRYKTIEQNIYGAPSTTEHCNLCQTALAAIISGTQRTRASTSGIYAAGTLTPGVATPDPSLASSVFCAGQTVNL